MATTTTTIDQTIQGIELPEDLEACHALIKDLLEQVQQKEISITALVERVRWLNREKFGSTSEKVPADQLSLFATLLAQALEEHDVAQPEATDQPATADPPKKKHFGGGRNKAPQNAVRERIEHRPSDAELLCGCGRKMTEFGHDISEQIDYVPASFTVIEHVRYKYSCKACDGTVVQGKKPDQLLSGGSATEGLIAQISTAKYADHLPLYRQEQIFDREGFDISQSSMGRWLEVSAKKLNQITERMHELLMQCEVLQADESPFDFVQRVERKTKAKQGYVWALYGDERHPYVYYRFESSRNAETAQKLLKGFNGVLTTDGYSGYSWFPPERSANCNIHGRRYFEKAENYDKKKAGAILALYSSLYKIEKELKGKSPEEILRARKEQSLPIMTQLHTLLKAWQLTVPPKTTLGVAINYSLVRWEKLTRFLTNAALSPDTNLVENAIRPIALGRKNWQQIGGEGGLHTASVHSTLVNTCKRLGINPYWYLRDVLIRLSEGEDQIDDLLPNRWKLKHSPPPPQREDQADTRADTVG